MQKRLTETLTPPRWTDGRSEALSHRFASVRNRSIALVDGLNDAEVCIQSMTDASPAKWHLAHTTWFFETFLARDHFPGYRVFDENYGYLYNSYYEAEGARHPRAERGMVTRPNLTDVLAWRHHVDSVVQNILSDLPSELLDLVEQVLKWRRKAVRANHRWWAMPNVVGVYPAIQTR